MRNPRRAGRPDSNPWRTSLLGLGLAMSLLYPWWRVARVGRGQVPLAPSDETPSLVRHEEPLPLLSSDAARVAREGRLALERGDAGGAVRIFTMASNLDPLYLEAYRGLGEACLAAGDLACAERAYRALARAAAWDPEADG